MIDNIVPEIAVPVPERPKTTRIAHNPVITRQKMGEYFINDKVDTSIKKQKITEEFLMGHDLEETHQGKDLQHKKERKRNIFGKTVILTSPEDTRKVEETENEIKFVNLVTHYHNRLYKSIESRGELIEDHKEEFLDSLSIGILYGLCKDNLQSVKPSDFSKLIETEQFKTAKSTVLLSLAEASLERFENPNGDTTEIDIFAKYIKSKAKPSDELPRSNSEWRNLFVVYLENNPQEFLQDYFVDFRFSEDIDALNNSRNIFKLGEIVAGEVIADNKISRSKMIDVEEFLPYEDKEHSFTDPKEGMEKDIVISRRYWGEKMEAELFEDQQTKLNLREALHQQESEVHRTKQALLDLGIIEQDGPVSRANSEFIEIFENFYTKDTESKYGQNQMILGMLYSMRKELGVGVISQTEVLDRAQKIIPALRRIGNDLMTHFIGNNLSEFYPELVNHLLDGGHKGILSERLENELKAIVREEGRNNYEQEVFTIISRNRSDMTRLIVNNSQVDGFRIGEVFGDILKRNASEKMTIDRENIAKLDSQLQDENAVMKLLIEGEQIEDPKVRERVEATMRKTSRLQKFMERSATKTKIAFQNKLFSLEGEGMFMATPSLATEGKSVTIGAAAAISFGHLINYVMEDPVNRAVQAGIFVAGYFITKEGGAYFKEIKAQKLEKNLVKPKLQGKIFTKERRGNKKEFKKELKEYKGQMKLIKREVDKKFWHNKGKLLYSSGSYLITSLGINYLLGQVGLSGPEAPMVLAATNVAVSGALASIGVRSGAEFIINWLSGKKAVDVGMELLTGNKKQEAVQKKLNKKKKNKATEYIKKKGQLIATSIASRIQEIKFVKNITKDITEQNKHLEILERFINKKNNPKEKFTKKELIDVVEFLNWMKEEEGVLLIHNPRYYSQRRINRPDGPVYVNNREGLKNIDKTRKEILEYAQSNLPFDEYQEIAKKTLDFYADVRNIREKVFHKRMKYLIASYGYRITFMVFSHALQSQGGLLEKPANWLLGDSTKDRQFIISQDPTEVFHANVGSPEGKEALAKEIWARAEELNNLAHLMASSDQLSEFQPGQESNLAYYNVTQDQMTYIINALKGSEDNPSNLNTSDLMKFVYILSSYKEGQEYLSRIPGIDGTERRNLEPLMSNISRDPVGFMKNVASLKENAALISLKDPILAEKLGIKSQSLADQINPLVIPETAKEQILAGARVGGNPIVITTLGPQVIVVGDVASEFVDGIGDRQSKIDFITQMKEILESDSSTLQLAVNSHFSSFLADANQDVDIAGHQELTEKTINRLSGSSVIYKIFQAIHPESKEEISRVIGLINKAKDGDVNSYSQLYQLVYSSKESTDLVSHIASSDTPRVNIRSISLLPEDSIVYKIIHEINPKSQEEKLRVIELINKTISGDVKANGELLQMIVAKDRLQVESIFDSKVNSDIYDRILDGLPGDPVERKTEIVRRLQQEMIGMGLRPVGAPILDMKEMTDLSHNPDLFTDPREALIKALSQENTDLEHAVALTGETKTLFVQEKEAVGYIQKDLQYTVESYSPEVLAMVKSVEGAESDNNQLAVPTIIGRNLKYVVRHAFGLEATASGATPPAGTLIEMMTGPFGHGAINLEAPSALHNYDAYGPGYLTKLIVAHFRGRIPEELLTQMSPDADLTQSIHGKDPSWIDRLCNKFETLIAEKALVAKYGEDKVLSVYLNHVYLGNVDGIPLKGVEAVSQVLFQKPFNDLTPGQQFLIIASGQAPGEYLYDPGIDAEGNPIQVANPAKAITHAIHIIEEGNIGKKLDIYFPGGKEQILKDLHAMDDIVKSDGTDKGWEKVFNMHLPADVQNFIGTQDVMKYAGMTREQLAEAVKNGEIKISFKNQVMIIELGDFKVEGTTMINPEDLMTPEQLTQEQLIHGQLNAQYSAIITDAKLEGDYYITKDGVQIPAWKTVFIDKETGQTVETDVPGMAIVSLNGGPEHIVSMIDPTGAMKEGPQMIGSIYKPLVMYYALATDKYYGDPEKAFSNMTFNAAPITIDGLPIKNSVIETDFAGNISLTQALSSSANVPFARLWAIMRDRDPNFWEHFQKFSREQWGIVYYEVNDKGDWVERKTEPLSDAGFGNLYVGGIDPKQSGLIPVAEAYRKIGEAAYIGKVDGIFDVKMKQQMIEAGKLVVFGLTDEDLKRKGLVWDEKQIADFIKVCGINGELCAGKTGTQSGVDKYGNWIAIRGGTYFMKYYPEVPATSTTPAIPARVDVLGIMTAGRDENNNSVDSGWAGENVLSTARKLTEALGNQSSIDSAMHDLDTLLFTPDMAHGYKLGAVSVEQFYPFLKDLSPPNEEGYSPYNELTDAVLHGRTKYLIVDLVGDPVGKVQRIAIHLAKSDGQDKIFTLDVSASMVEPAGEAMNHFADTSSQIAINEILTKAVATEPEKYADLLAQFQNQGVNFIPLNGYESSPALFTIHEHMEKNNELFSGGENFSRMMKDLGMDPKTTVFVNNEMFKVLQKLNQDTIKEQLFNQREYLAMVNIYESSGLPGGLDGLLYDADMTTNSAHQLLKIFAETKTSQMFTSISGEREFLIKKFQELINDPITAEKIAPDVIRAYQRYNEMTSGLARGVAPTPEQSKDFIDALKNFTNTTQKSTLMSLGIKPNEEVINSTPLPFDVINSNVIDPSTTVTEHVVEAVAQAPKTPLVIIDEFIAHPENFASMSIEEKMTAELIIGKAQIFLDIVESPKGKSLSGLPLMYLIISEFKKNEIPIDGDLLTYISLYSAKRDCGDTSLIMTNILSKLDPKTFHDLGDVDGAGDSTKSFLSYLIGQHEIDKSVNEVITPGEKFLEKFISDISQVQPGDQIVVGFPWLDGANDRDNYSHIVTVVLKGIEDGRPYILVFESDSDNGGITQFRKIFSLNDFVSQHVRDQRTQMYPDPTIATPPDPIFGIIRYVGGGEQAFIP